MRYKVTLIKPEDDKVFWFDSIDVFQNEFIGDEYYINLINEIYDEVDLPYVGKVPAGEVLWAFLQKNDKEVVWEYLTEDFAMKEFKFILDELAQYGEMYYDNYKIVDMNFEAKEE